jgi:3,4-dihydroxy 2-butanone 4-phosphate synthase/GTP cyclohydrolase II
LSLANADTKPHDLADLDISSLNCQTGGVLRRTGHTEAAIDFARLGFKSAGVIVEIMNEDGSMARLPNWLK